MPSPLFQNDPRWKDTPIGLQNSLTISQVGCLLTSMAMVMNHFGASETPASLNARMKAANGFSGAWIKAAQVPAQFPQLGVVRQKHLECKGQPAPLDLVDAAIAAGSLVVVRVDWTPDAAIDSHWVVIHAKRGSDYAIWDPWQLDDAPDTLQGRYGFGVKTPADIILELIWHGKGALPEAPPAASPAAQPAPQPKQDPSPAPAAPAGSLAVKPTVAQLRMRAQPAVRADNLVTVVSPQDALTVLEETAAARQKIGQQGQWLHVRTAAGQSGYVAAWMVRETAVSAPRSDPHPAPAAPAARTVSVSAQSLSLRSEPRVTAQSLIRYLPQGHKLKAIDPDAAAKIGVQGQWLHVEDGDGTQGYVAAWFVK